MNSEVKNCQNCKADFVVEPEDFEFYEKIKVPAPTFCPDCRAQRRFVWRNESHLYKRKCDGTGKDIFSMFHPEAGVKVYEHSYWWSDNWDPMEYGREYDFNRPFFEQIGKLIKEVPWFDRSVLNMVNSDYCMNANDLKNCYLLFHSSKDEDCSYGVGVESSRDCHDNLYVGRCEFCYENFGSEGCYNVHYSVDCVDSRNLYLCKDCSNCSDCFGCVNLRNKQYYIFNEPYTKEEYEKKIKELNLGSYKNFLECKKRQAELAEKFPVKFAHENKNVNVTGEYVYASKNVKKSYIIDGAEDCRYCQDSISSPGIKDCYDYTIWGANVERVYETTQSGIDVADLKFCAFVYPSSQRLEYSVNCHSSSDLFGCVGLTKKQYCIFNKQYSKEEYEKLKEKIVAHMNELPYTDKGGRVYKYGEFFPIELNPVEYNESLGQEFFPLSKEKALEQGYGWRDMAEKSHVETVSWRDLPDDIEEVDEAILKERILCQSWDEDKVGAVEHGCSKVFIITPGELGFYRKVGVPLPRRCFKSRHFERTKLRNPMKLWKRKCQCAGEKSDDGGYANNSSHENHGAEHCPNEFETSYSPERKDVIYCKDCYQYEVV